MAEQSLQARLERIIFQNPSSGYAVASFKDLENRQSFTAAGHLENPEEDQSYLLEGKFVMHKRFGRQFEIQASARILPTAKSAVVEFLSSRTFPGIGTKTAEAIYEALGEDCLESIAADSSCLSQIPELSPKKIEVIRSGIASFGTSRDTFLKLSEMGLSERMIALLNKNYTDLFSVLEKDPFHPYYHVYGFGYKSALKLADGFGIDPEDVRRQEAQINEYARSLAIQKGDTYVTFYDLYEKVKGMDIQLFEDCLARLQSIGVINIQEQRVYPFELLQDEQSIASLLLQHSFPLTPTEEEQLEQHIAKIEKQNGIEYDKRQKEAIRMFFEESFFLLNGGPGTGKSTTVKGILQICQLLFPGSMIQLAAPTGRAAKRLSQLSDCEARTIHSLLKWNKEENTFDMNEDNLLECDFLIVDEFSMVDTHLFASLLKALPHRCRILLIGDEDQLESVGPGKVFADLIASRICPVVHLERIFRQKHGSGIVSLASQIRKEQPCQYEEGVLFEEKEGEEILEQLLKDYPLEADLYDVQVLAPKYKGIAGIDAANEAIQQLVNPPDPAKKELRFGNVIFRQDDKVMLTRNMPEEEVFNGDIGRISYISKKDAAIEVEFSEDSYVTFEKEGISALSLAYCVSVHKAQGSEFQSVFCLIDPGARWMMNKRLLYTAVSRAKKQLEIIGDQSLFESKVRLQQRMQRHTSLQEAIASVRRPVSKYH